MGKRKRRSRRSKPYLSNPQKTVKQQDTSATPQASESMSGESKTYYVHSPMGLERQQQPDGSWVFPIQDGLGSVRGVVGNNWPDLDVLESRQYDPYGALFDAHGASQTPYGFTGEMADPNGLVYLRARYLNPQLGAFVSQDSVEGNVNDPMSLNRYAYAHGNPINRADPSGHMSISQQINYMLQVDPRRFAEMMNSGCFPGLQEPTPPPHPCQTEPVIGPHAPCIDQAMYLGGNLWNGPGTDWDIIAHIRPGVEINPGDRVTLIRSCFGTTYGTNALWYEIQLGRDSTVRGWVWANNIQLLDPGCVPALPSPPTTSPLNPKPVFGHWGASEIWAVAAGPCQYGNEQCRSDPNHLAVDVVPVSPGELSQIQNNPNVFAGTPVYAPFDGTILSGYASNYQEFALDLDPPHSGIRIIFSHACSTIAGHVLAGQEIGKLAFIGGTADQACVDNSLGTDTFAHLHFQVFRREPSGLRAIPPHDYLR